MTQTEQLLDYLDRYGSVEPLEALRDLGIFRLAARIYDIEQQGITIPRETFTFTKRDGTKGHATRYFAPEPQRKLF